MNKYSTNTEIHVLIMKYFFNATSFYNNLLLLSSVCKNDLLV